MRLVIVTDLDGTLLDPVTYAAREALPALRRAVDAGVPLVFCSSKTRAEIAVVQRRLGIRDPFISENGGAVFTPDGYFPRLPPEAVPAAGFAVVELGWPYAEVVSRLQAAVAETGVRVLGFASMTVEDIALDCGLSLLDAQLAKLREFDEPFRVLEGDAGARSRLLSALHGRGLRTVHGGRYFHATGPTDKGAATAVLRAIFAGAGPRPIVAGLGDGLNDASLLKAVDIPVIVRSDMTDATARLLRKVPTAQVTTDAGPAGWARAVQGLIDRWETGRLRPKAWTVRG
jgi:mannosyl-3-phosphoglycerate phosphatase